MHAGNVLYVGVTPMLFANDSFVQFLYVDTFKAMIVKRLKITKKIIANFVHRKFLS